MKVLIAIVLFVAAITAFVVLNRQQTTNTELTGPASANGSGPVPVVVELFTSEGCSSCPPADDVLATLDQAQPLPGVEIIALGQHVDYWNRLGWVDPYSSAEFSERQRAYAVSFGKDGVYTPQMIVDGRDEFVGSNADRARESIARAARVEKAHVKLNLSESANGLARVAINVTKLPVGSSRGTKELVLAITENGISTYVSRGENAGMSLKHRAVVRRLSQLGTLEADKTDYQGEVSIRLENSWRRENLAVVVFVQERNSRRVLGAAKLALTRR